MSAFDPFGKSLGTFIDERLSSPLVSSFAIAWSLWNYKVFFILFADLPLKERFKWLHDERFAGLDFFANGLVLPLVFALLYIYLLPIPARMVYRAWRINLKKNDDIKAEYDNQKPINAEEARQYRKKFRDFEDEIDKLNGIVRSQREDLQKESLRNAELEATVISTEQLRADSKQNRDQLVDTHDQLLMEKELTTVLAKWLKELIDAAEVGDKPIDAEIATFENALTSMLIQGGVRNQDQINSVRKMIQPFAAYRKNLVTAATRINREQMLRRLTANSRVAEKTPQPEESEVTGRPGSVLQTVVGRTVRPSECCLPLKTDPVRAPIFIES